MARSPARKVPLWLVVRVDGPIEGYDEKSLRNGITVVEAFPTAEEAEDEVARLNELNRGKRCIYFCTFTRFFPNGRDVQRGY